MAQLPLYYKNSKATGPKSTTKRWKEYYLLVITIVGFIILIAGVVWFVPGMEEDKSYNRAYDSFTALGDIKVTKTLDVDDPSGQKLEEKVSLPEPPSTDKHPPKEREDTPVEKGVSNEAVSRVSKKMVNEEVQVEAIDRAGGQESAETEQRREKVVNVRKSVYTSLLV